jgi:hydroxyacylglutathione hydrolase
MKIKQFRYNADNLAYLIHNRGAALAVDGGAVSAMVHFIEEKGLALVGVTHTHGHPDHTTGSRELAEAAGASLMDHRRFSDGQQIDLGGQPVRVLHTPGHTADSITFAFDGALVTGDTLFNGTVGNCFSGDLDAFYRSIERLAAFPPATRVFAGHDYVRASMAFARQLEPGNGEIDAFLAAYTPYAVVSTLADERAVNPYLRFNTPAMIELMTQRGMDVSTPYRRWCSMMTLA